MLYKSAFQFQQGPCGKPRKRSTSLQNHHTYHPRIRMRRVEDFGCSHIIGLLQRMQRLVRETNRGQRLYTHTLQKFKLLNIGVTFLDWLHLWYRKEDVRKKAIGGEKVRFHWHLLRRSRQDHACDDKKIFHS